MEAAWNCDGCHRTGGFIKKKKYYARGLYLKCLDAANIF
jgi:hypothetical protein